CFYGVLDVVAQTFTYTSAGHNPPVFYRRGEGPRRVTLRGIALGVIEDVDLQEATLSLKPGDRLVLYTDGITESINPAGKQFGMDGLESVLAEADGTNAPDTVAAVLAAVEKWADEAPQFDDIAIAVVHASDTMETSPELLRETLSRR
ncbi:MAG: serine/threonine-protein phosphatase, partial [Armatimonadetes bacterium]|nr:serine/threonine-protein phosphatase [Armatimonadota bacterium]